eukprot:GGOE01037129.1.p1 GENE.GGOE01037129.1~~GGOE01037129.1.p1  ORF type:complete len:325 (+),score=61.73 GGOE01037129.1:91-1065(+)
MPLGGAPTIPAGPWHWLQTDSSPVTSVLVASLFGCLGVVGSFFLILTYCCCRRLRTDHRTILCLVSLCDLGQAVQFCLLPLYFIPRLRPCVCAAPLLGHLTYLPGCVLNACLAFHVYHTLQQASQALPKGPRRFPFGTVLIVCALLIVSLAAALLCTADWQSLLLSYAEAPATQYDLLPWVLQQKSSHEWFAFIHLAVFCVCALAIIVANGFAAKRLAEHEKEWDYNPQLQEFKTRLLYVPMNFLLTRVPGIAYIVAQSLWGIHCSPGWLMMLIAIGEPSEGLWNGILFGPMSTSAKETVTEAWVRHFGRRRSQYQPLFCKEAI